MKPVLTEPSEDPVELKRPSTGRKKPRQVWGVNNINFAGGRKMPTTTNVLDLDNHAKDENEEEKEDSVQPLIEDAS